MILESPFASPIGLSRDPYWDDAWTEGNTYVLPHPDNEFEQLRAGRASELGKTISNTFTLNRWHKEQVLKGVVIRPSIQQAAYIAMHDGLTSKQLKRKIWDLCKEAEDVAGSKEPAAIGTGFHKITELWDARSITVERTPPPWDRDLLAYAEILTRTGIVAVPEFTERIVWNEPINTAGRFDRLWRYLRHCDKWHVGDLKTGRYIEHGWGENPIQLWCYANATHLFDHKNKTWSPMPEMCTDVGLILHVPSDGKKYLEDEVMATGEIAEGGEPTGNRMAALYEVDLTTRIQAPGVRFLMGGTLTPAELAKAVQDWHKASKKVARMVARVEVKPDGEVIDSPLSVREQIEMAESEAELAELRRIYLVRKEWNGWHTRWARERLEILSS